MNREERPNRLDDCNPTTFHAIVSTITEFTGMPHAEAEARVWNEVIEPGWNVRRDVARFGVTPFHFDDQMARLYGEGDGFIFDSLLFWARPIRRSWIRHTLDRIQTHAERTARQVGDLQVLMFGDGPGNDSLFLARSGVTVHYHEVPGSRTYDFAVARFHRCGLWGTRILPVESPLSQMTEQYDVVVSFEVLEHLPEPLAQIVQISSILKTGGIALVTDDFGDLTPALPTHLRSSARYLGATPFLFMKHGMRLTWYSTEELFKPYEFTKSEFASTWRDRLSLMRDRNVRGHYLSRPFGRLSRLIAKLPYFRFYQGR